MDYNKDIADSLCTVAELPGYIRLAGKLLSSGERQDLINFLAAHPYAGDMMEGTGGIRKIRWCRTGQGKRGGVRVIYYYHSGRMPLYLLTLFAKGEKDNLSHAERNELAKLVDVLTSVWKERGAL